MVPGDVFIYSHLYRGRCSSVLFSVLSQLIHVNTSKHATKMKPKRSDVSMFPGGFPFDDSRFPSFRPLGFPRHLCHWKNSLKHRHSPCRLRVFWATRRLSDSLTDWVEEFNGPGMMAIMLRGSGSQEFERKRPMTLMTCRRLRISNQKDTASENMTSKFWCFCCENACICLRHC